MLNEQSESHESQPLNRHQKLSKHQQLNQFGKMQQRRRWLKAALANASSVSIAATLGALGPGRAAWATSSPAAVDRRLVVIILRGALDGLNTVVPYQENNYYRLRPTIAVARPGEIDGLIDLDGRFGLHPGLAVLKPYWDQGSLGFIHASGSPDPTRSHFDAQDYLESATPGRKSTPTGWMNRLLGALNHDAPLLRAVNVGVNLPRIYSGPGNIATIASGDAATRPLATDRPAVNEAFARLYTGDDAMSQAFRDAGASRREIVAGLEGVDTQADNGAVSLRGFAQDANRLGSLMRRDARVQLGFIAVGGWDTHVNQGDGRGALAGKLVQLGEGLNQLSKSLGERFADTVIMVMSEFGRTVRQNGNNGTDHGHGNVIWMLGGAVNGRRVHGEWPGLDDSALYEGRDLAVTSDFRQVAADVCARHLRLSDAQLAKVFIDMPQGRVALNTLRS